jgi:hypothetical protein
MHGWLEVDDRGRQLLVRTGTGVVTAVSPIGIPDAHEDHSTCVVEIYCDAPHGRPGSIRYSIHALVPTGHPLYREALEVLEQVWPVAWTVRWLRHEWIPDDLPIASLDLATDARAILCGLERVLLPEPLASDVPDFVPVHWRKAE